MKKSNIVGLIIAVLGCVAVIVFAGWFINDKAPTILQGEADVTSYKASSKIPGRIDEIFVTQGQIVKKGELLYTLSTPEIDAKLNQAKAVQVAAGAQSKKASVGARVQQIAGAKSMWKKSIAGLTLANATYQRIKNLYDNGVVPAQKYDEAFANLEASKATAQAAKSQYDMALAGTRKEDKIAAEALLAQATSVVAEVELYVSDACVYSPVDGEVSTIIAEQGELVGAGYPVITVLDMSSVWTSFNIKETLLPKIKVGTKLVGYVPALDVNVEFKVYYIAAQASFATWSATRTQGGFDVRTFNVKARTSATIPDFRPGMSVIVDWDKIQ